VTPAHSASAKPDDLQIAATLSCAYFGTAKFIALEQQPKSKPSAFCIKIIESLGPAEQHQTISTSFLGIHPLDGGSSTGIVSK
jgi:hypothetical protein